MTPFRIALMTCVATCVVSAAIGAQSAPSSSPRTPMPLRQTLTVDLGAALDERWRLTVEPLVLGRFTLGLSGSRTTEAVQSVPQILYSVTRLDPFAPCLPGGQCYPFPTGAPTYRASSLALHARWYPAALSRAGDRQGFAVYVGEFLSREERRISWPEWISPPYSPFPDTLLIPGIPRPIAPWIGPAWVQQLRGWEPGAELGARVMMGNRVLIDVGGEVRVATLDDPFARRRPGRTDARFAVAIGIGW